MSEVVLSIDHLSKHYGRIKAVDQLSLTIEKGNIYGILGPNGSGKTTSLGIVLGVINPLSGSYKWFGQTPTKYHRKKIGAILETPNFYPYLSGLKNLELVADIKGASYDEIDQVLKTVDLKERMHSKFKTYSLGMKQRLAIAAALIGNPEVLILDEPTNGLDPQGIAEIRSLIQKIASKGMTIILASHLLDEVQKVCTHVAVLEKGKKLFSGGVNEVLSETLLIEIGSPDMESLKNALTNFKKVIKIELEGNILLAHMSEGAVSGELNKYLFENGIVVSHIAIRKKSLEKYFLELLAAKND